MNDQAKTNQELIEENTLNEPPRRKRRGILADYQFFYAASGGEYNPKRFNISKDQPLAATEYVAKRRQAALDRGLGEKLVAARAARKAKQTGE